MPTEYRRENRKCERDRANIVQPIFLGNGVTDRRKESTTPKVS